MFSYYIYMTKSQTFTFNVYADTDGAPEYALNINIDELKKYNKFKVYVKDFAIKTSLLTEDNSINSDIITLQSNTLTILNNYETPSPAMILSIYQSAETLAYRKRMQILQQEAYTVSINAAKITAYNNALTAGQTVEQALAAAEAAAINPTNISNAQTAFNNAATDPANIANAEAAGEAAGDAAVAEFTQSTPLKNSGILAFVVQKQPYFTGQTNEFTITNPNGRHRFYLRNFEGNNVSVNFFFTLVIVASQ
jgi:hypothetical protein